MSRHAASAVFGLSCLLLVSGCRGTVGTTIAAATDAPSAGDPVTTLGDALGDAPGEPESPPGEPGSPPGDNSSPPGDDATGADPAPPGTGPIVIFKFDDFYCRAFNWPGVGVTVDEIATYGIKANFGLFTADLAPGGTCDDSQTVYPDASKFYNGMTYLQYLNSMVDNPSFELWFHAFNGLSKEEFNDGLDHLFFPDAQPIAGDASQIYATEKSWFEEARFNVLYQTDFLMRTYGPHYHSDGSILGTVFNDDPYLQTWFTDQVSSVTKAGAADLVSADYTCVALETLRGNPVDYGLEHPGAIVDLPTFTANYEGACDATTCCGRDHLVLLGHPVRWNENLNGPSDDYFRDIVTFLKGKGVRFMTVGQYYRMMNGITDGTPPTVPTDLLLQQSGTTVTVSWSASSAPSGVDAYKVYRDGTFIGITRNTSYSDETTLPLPSGTQYRVAAVSRANLSSARSAPQSL